VAGPVLPFMSIAMSEGRGGRRGGKEMGTDQLLALFRPFWKLVWFSEVEVEVE
jgi:hypothetical protein